MYRSHNNTNTNDININKYLYLSHYHTIQILIDICTYMHTCALTVPKLESISLAEKLHSTYFSYIHTYHHHHHYYYYYYYYSKSAHPSHKHSRTLVYEISDFNRCARTFALSHLRTTLFTPHHTFVVIAAAILWCFFSIIIGLSPQPSRIVRMMLCAPFSLARRCEFTKGQ